MSDKYEECDRCGNDSLPEAMQYVVLETGHQLCEGCLRAMEDDVEYYDWQDRYTEEQHERAIELFSERDEFECVISSYEDGQVVLHTPYVSSDVVTDFCNHFGYRIAAFTPRWEVENEWPCMSQHGDTFEIMLEYNSQCSPPIPLPAKFQENHIEQIKAPDKQF